MSSGYLFTLLLLVMFTLGGSTGIVLGNAAVDVALHDTYYVIAHFHFMLSLGAMIATVCGVVYFQEVMIAGFPLSVAVVSVYYFTHKSLGVMMTFFPLHLLGYNFQPRRVYEFPDVYTSWSSLSSLGSGVTVLSMTLILVYIPDT